MLEPHPRIEPPDDDCSFELSDGPVLPCQPDTIHITFEELMSSHHLTVYKVCLRTLRDRDAAEDATQETFAAAWRHRHRLGAPGIHWLLVVAMNKCRDELRKRRRHPACELDTVQGEAECLTSTERSPEDAALTRCLKDELEFALGALPAHQRTAVSLICVEEFTLREAAQKIGVSIGTVKSRVFRGRIRLREILAQRLEDPI